MVKKVQVRKIYSIKVTLCRQGAGAGGQVGERWRWIVATLAFEADVREWQCARDPSLSNLQSPLLCCLVSFRDGHWTPPRKTCLSWFPPEIAEATGRNLRFAGHNGHKIQSTNTYYLNALDLMMNY